MAVDVAMMTSPPHTQFIDEPKWPIISLILFYSTSSRNNKNSKSPNFALALVIQNSTFDLELDNT
jgi:hypothetical protein